VREFGVREVNLSLVAASLLVTDPDSADASIG